MRARPQLLIWTSWFLYGIAWFLPVFENSPGWLAVIQIFLFKSDSLFEAWYYAVLAAASVLTNFIFLVCPLLVVCPQYARPRSRMRKLGWAAAAAFLINGYWLVQEVTGRFDFRQNELKVGYFLWWGSFLVLAVGLFDLAGPRDAADVSPS